MKLLLIFNPRAGGGRARRQLPQIRAELERRGLAAEILVCDRPGESLRAIAEREPGGLSGIVVAGGDGSVFEALNGLVRHAPDQRPPLGIIPIGTGNAFARDLGLEPGDWRQAIDLIAQGRVRRVDVARVTTSTESWYFLNVMHLGFGVEAGLTALKLKALGPLAYTLGTLWQTVGLRSHRLRIEIDGEQVLQDNVFVTIANTRYTGASFLIAPGAVMNDGLLEVVLLRRLPRLRLLRLFPTIYAGGHVRYPEVSVLRGRRIRLLEPEGLLLAPDGEFRGKTPVEIDCLPRELAVFVHGSSETGFDVRFPEHTYKPRMV